MEKKRQIRADTRKRSVDEKSIIKDSSILETPPQQPQHAQQPASYATIHQKRPDRMAKDEDSETKSNNTVHSYKSLNKPNEPNDIKRIPKP